MFTLHAIYSDHTTTTTHYATLEELKDALALIDQSDLIDYDIYDDDVDDFESPYGHHNGIAPSQFVFGECVVTFPF